VTEPFRILQEAPFSMKLYVLSVVGLPLLCEAVAVMNLAHARGRSHKRTIFNKLGTPEEATRSSTPVHNATVVVASQNGTHSGTVVNPRATVNHSNATQTLRSVVNNSALTMNGPLTAEAQKLLHFMSQPDELGFDYKKFNRTFPTESSFIPPCLEHVNRLVNKLDTSYTDEQLKQVLEHECWLMDEFQYTFYDSFETKHKRYCSRFAEELVEARLQELETGSDRGYIRFCQRYYTYQQELAPASREVGKSDSLHAKKAKSGSYVSSLLGCAVVLLLSTLSP